MAITSRLAISSDIIPIRKLAIESFSSAYARFNTEENMRQYLTEHFSEEKLLQEINEGLILLGLHEQRIVAYAKLVKPEANKIPGRNPLEIARLYTDVNLIGQRIGVCMMNHIANEARARSCDSICLDVWQKNFRAVNFYQREYFRIVGTTRFILGEDVQDDFVMLRKLEDEELVLETERLKLINYNSKRDAAYFIELVNSPGWLKYIGDRNVHTEDVAIEYLNNRVMKAYAENGWGGYVVVEKSTGKSIGNAGLFKRPALDDADIGYAFLPEYHGKGYALEATLAVMAYAKKLGMRKLNAITVAYNERSIHLLQKLGLKFEKYFRMEGDPEELSLYSIEL
jgi:RimJ/RimL family protein N-acetyltransferase